MDKELNNYHIKNPDGADKTVCNNGKQSYLNDSPRFVKENSSKGQSEWNNSVSEGYFDSENQRVGNADISAQSGGLSSPSASATSSAVSSGAASATSAASAIGGSFGALAGTVAASVMSAVIVVAAFVSTLTVNLSLVMATMYSLVFQLELSGAQEEDFATPIVAVLEGDNDVYREREITIDSVYITFDDLEPSTEYIITIKNQEKTFFKKSYFTASEQTEKGSVSARFTNGEVIVSVADVDLKAGEYYTLTAKDDKGNVVFAKDDVEPNKEFAFLLSEPADLYFALSVGGNTYAVSELKLRTAQYDYESGVWSWSQDYGSASITFREVHGGEPLTVAAEIAVSEVAPTCEENGRFVYVATANCNGTQYKDTKTAVRENTALGHDYGEPEFIWEQSLTGGYSAKAVRTCIHNAEHTEIFDATVRESHIDPTCEEDGKTIYYAVVPDTDFSNEKIITESGTALGHNYSVHFEWMQEDNGYTATATYVCSRDESHSGVMDAVVSEKNGTYFAEVQLDGKTYRGQYGDTALSLNDGNIEIYADGYLQSGTFTPFENTADNRYIISGSRTSDTPLKFYTNAYNGASVSDGVNFYVNFDNATVKGSSWASAVVIKVYANVNLFINNYGTTRINPYNHPAFLIEGNSGYSVNIDVTSENGFNSFICERQYNGTPTLYTAYSGATFKMNGDSYDNNGNKQ